NVLRMAGCLGVWGAARLGWSPSSIGRSERVLSGRASLTQIRPPVFGSGPDVLAPDTLRMRSARPGCALRFRRAGPAHFVNLIPIFSLCEYFFAVRMVLGTPGSVKSGQPEADLGPPSKPLA